MSPNDPKRTCGAAVPYVRRVVPGAGKARSIWSEHRVAITEQQNDSEIVGRIYSIRAGG